jgi:small subunit ribosomal protein S3
MGQKVNPISFRLQVHKNWNSRWFAGKKDFAKWLAEDIKIRELIEKRFESRPTIGTIEIERSANLITVTIHTAKAGVVIGRGGAGVTELKSQIEKIASLPVRINIEEIKRPDLNAKLVAENIARQLERRGNFRRAMKMAAQNTINAGAKGIRIQVAGRLNNAEMARREKLIEGSVPLHTLRADIDYGFAEADTTYGKVGVKVWIYEGEVLPTKNNANANVEKEGSDK